MLVISLIAFAQYTQKYEATNIENYVADSSSKITNYEVHFEVNQVEEDAAFDFNTKDYLPFDFDANSKVGMPEFKLTLEESDEPLDFYTADYLPVGFNPYVTSELIVYYEVESEEEDAEFDFDTALYLPQGFNPYLNLKQAIDIAIR